MAEYLIFDSNYLDIPLQDIPENHVIICLDPQHRIKKDKTWAVVRTAHNPNDTPPKALGLFWDKDMAGIFAKAIPEAEDAK